MTSVSPGDAAAAAGHAGQPGAQGFATTSAEFFLQNYRLGKTLGIGSFGKVGRPRAGGRRSPGAAALQGAFRRRCGRRAAAAPAFAAACRSRWRSTS